jgi:hypothetical protein
MHLLPRDPPITCGRDQPICGGDDEGGPFVMDEPYAAWEATGVDSGKTKNKIGRM